MDKIIKIEKTKLYLFASESLRKAFIIVYDETASNHIGGSEVSYNNLSEGYIRFLMDRNNYTKCAYAKLDKIKDNRCYFIAEDLEDKKDILMVYKDKKKLAIDSPFEEAPPIPEDLNI